MNRKKKGEFGYLDYRKKASVIRTLVCLLVAVALFVAGLIINGSQKNIFSIVAALGCLPTGWSAVNMIMFLRGKGCSQNAYDNIRQVCGGLLIHYDHVITSYEKNYNVAASTVLDKNICCLTEDPTVDTGDIEKHIKKMMAQNGYSSYSIKVFDKLDAFTDRLSQLEKLRQEKGIDPQAIEDTWLPGTVQTPASVLLSISL